MTSTLKVTTIEATTLKKGASTTNATLNDNGTMTPGNAHHITNAWDSSFKVGILNSTYGAFDGSAYMDSSHATSINTAIHLISSRLVYISFYFYRNAHFGTWSNTYGWGIQLPSDIIPVGGTGYAYQSIHSNYFGMNGTNYYNTDPHRWQANQNRSNENQNMLVLYGSQGTTNWASGAFEVAGNGVLALATDVTTAYGA